MHERHDVDAVDLDVEQLAADVDVDQFDAAHHDAAHVDRAKGRVREIDGAKRRTPQPDALEARATEILTTEFGHGQTVEPPHGSRPRTRILLLPDRWL